MSLVAEVAPDRNASIPRPTHHEEPRRTSGLTRIRLGFVAMFIPRSIAQPLGMVAIGGGRGLWLAAEVDTVYFDLALLALLYHLSRTNSRLSWKDPATWQVVLTTVLVAGALAYVITNFGTLMRYRAMILCGYTCLLVLCGRPREPREGTDQPQGASRSL